MNRIRKAYRARGCQQGRGIRFALSFQEEIFMRRTIFSTAVSLLMAFVWLDPTPAFAGQKSHSPAPKPTPAAKPTPPPKSTHFITRIENNSQLMSRLQPLLPSDMTLATAAQGFKAQGQFIAALHVSQNLKIPFAQLKAEMTGKDHDSLGQAIHALQPNTNAKAAVKTAEQEAKGDIKAAKPVKTDEDKNGR
jgi:hypothetical protein